MGYNEVTDAAGDEVTLERVQEFFDLLTQGKPPKGVEIPRWRNLSRRQAFSVIWFLQERMNLLPDRFEWCKKCGGLFDASEGGHTGVAGRWCEGCLPDWDEVADMERRAEQRIERMAGRSAEGGG